MMKDNHTQGVIYIMTNPSFPEYVKIGYADDVEERLRQLNRTECTPFAFRIYATYAVNKRLTDMKIHDVIDKINPDLRSIDTINGKKRIREFYAMSPEDAYDLFEAIADINGFEDRLKKWKLNDKQKNEEKLATEIIKEKKTKTSMFSFFDCGISVGEQVVFVHNSINSGAVATVVDDKHVEYDGITYSLTSLAKALLGKPDVHIPGPDYFQYKGKWLNDIRREKGLINF